MVVALVCLATAVRARQAAMPVDARQAAMPADARMTTPSAGAAPAAPSGVEAAVQDQALSPDSREFFEARVRPVLASNCYDCHTVDAAAGLHLDSLAGLLAGGESGPAITPGSPDTSLLVRAIRHERGAPRMPDGAPKLRDSDIDAIVQWIRAGAVWPDPTAGAPVPSHEKTITPEQRAFWSLQPLASPTVPAVRDASWARTDLDRFVLARLEQEGLAPVAPADRLALIRRATLDLTGVPPTPEEVDAFLADTSPTAFESVVDRLLASPRYGETWGRMWLDVARYGEDDYRSLDPQGRGLNPYPNAYLYRDWVVKAFNDDLPYDRFVRAQLAADLLPASERLRNLPALGFLGLGPWYYDNGAVEVTRADERHDRVDVVGRGLLGLTVACARCHDHKYDPILTKDYYALAGVFLNTEYHEYPLAPAAVVDDYKTREKEVEKQEDLLGDFLSTESQQLAETLAFQSVKYMVGAWKVRGEPKQDRLQVVNAAKLDFELFDRWLAFLDKPPVFYPFLRDWQAMIARGGTEPEATTLAEAFQALLVGVVLEKRAVDEENDIIRAQALPSSKPRVFANLPNEFKTNDDFCPGCGLSLRSMTTERTALWNDVFRADLDPDAAPGKPARPALLRFTGWGLERQLGPDRRALVEDLREAIETRKKALPAKFPYVHGVREMPGDPANLKVSLRGSPYRLGDEVPRGFLTVFGTDGGRPAFTRGSGRLELADAILAQPIALRVIVNRVWKGHFGTGIVETPSNFGVAGDRPSHPELLDYLATFFVEHGYSMKALHREIMRSAAYRLGTDMNQAAFDKDAGNRLFWRANRRRMSAEQIRDSVLAVSGALDAKMGGPSAPLTPLYDRRTIYGRVSRYRLDEFLQLFDFPSPSQTAEKRFSTNVPLQRLFFMNSDFMQQHAERLAARVAAEPTDDARIEKVYRLIFGRAPVAAELEAGREFLRTEPMRQYEDAKAEAAKAAAERARAAAAASQAAAAAGGTVAAGGTGVPGATAAATARVSRGHRHAGRRSRGAAAGRRHDGRRDAGRPPGG
ncbi:MAG: PSD1 and planctomycete cytochrome C domain-containing protein [Vicinamibacterales bacterium]